MPVQSATAARREDDPPRSMPMAPSYPSSAMLVGEWKVVVRSRRCRMTKKGEKRVEKQIAGDDTLLSTQRCELQREEGNSTEARNFGEEIVQERKISRRRGQKPLGCGGLPSGGVEPWRRGTVAGGPA